MSTITGASLMLPGARAVAATAARVAPFQVPLRIPQVLRPVRRTERRDYYEITLRHERAEILPGKRTPIWGFNGTFPGPTIKARRGREIVVRRINKLNVPVTTHLHGGDVPWRSDGHPVLSFRPGECYDYHYPNHQEAATLWYHDHMHGRTGRNNYRGLNGFYIIEDDEERDLNLPKGRYDVPLVLHDRTFNKDGSFRYRHTVDHLLGDIYLVNGRPMPYMKVANRKYRFRILNASNSRGYRLALDSGDPLVQIASDQGLLAAPYPAPEIPLWPAERAEVVIDFSKYPIGTNVVLLDGDAEDPTASRPIMQFRVEREEQDTSSLPPVLRTIQRLVPGPGTVEREFVLSKSLNTNTWLINGKAFDHHRIDIKPRLGSTEVWTFVNRSAMVHPMHVHLVKFQILERSGGVVTPGEMGWKDTVRVDASERAVRIIMKFESYTGRYLFHCHNLPHSDHAMMGQMQVVR